MLLERIDALKQALKMEQDGKAYYEKAFNQVENKLTKEIFKSLIKAEERHAQKIKRLYTSLEETGEWPDVALRRNTKETVDNIFATAFADLGERLKGTTTDIEALKSAAELEDQGIKYYQSKFLPYPP